MNLNVWAQNYKSTNVNRHIIFLSILLANQWKKPHHTESDIVNKIGLGRLFPRRGGGGGRMNPWHDILCPMPLPFAYFYLFPSSPPPLPLWLFTVVSATTIQSRRGGRKKRPLRPDFYFFSTAPSGRGKGIEKGKKKSPPLPSFLEVVFVGAVKGGFGGGGGGGGGLVRLSTVARRFGCLGKGGEGIV